MKLKTKIFLLSIFINIVILVYSAYCGRVFGHERCGYTFIGVSLWTVGIILATPADKTPKWYNVDKLLNYPLISLVVFIALLHASGLFDFFLKAIIFSAVGALLSYILQRKIKRKINKTAVLAYYLILLIFAWILLYEYPLVPLTYTPFVVYCAMNIFNQMKKRQQCCSGEMKL